jgi:hypothetical protein
MLVLVLLGVRAVLRTRSPGEVPLPLWECLSAPVARWGMTTELGGYVLLLVALGHPLPVAVLVMLAIAVAVRIATGRDRGADGLPGVAPMRA